MTPAESTAAASDGRVVLITGGSRGIGLACARWFLDRGDRVAVTSRGGVVEGALEGVVEGALEGVAGEGALDGGAGDGSGRFLSLTCDVTDGAQVDAAFSAVEEAWGPVEVLVANAGITRDTLILRMNDETWGDVIDTNLTGAFRVCKRAISKMLRLHRGRVILVSSVSAFIGSPGQVNYGASKAGLVGMARALAREVATRDITVNVVAPGLTDTDMLTALGDDRTAQLKALVPLGRTAKPEEIAEAIGFLASGGAAYITGALLPVDGGLAMGL